MKTLNLLTAILAAAGFGLLFIGMTQGIFNSTEVLLGTGVCMLSFILSITWEI
jgi:hypothetical protein